MKHWLSLVALVASVAHAGGVAFHRLDLGAEAQNGAFAEDLSGSGRRDLIALGFGRIAIFRSDPRQPAGFAPTPELIVTGPTAYFADVADVLPAKGKELLVMTPDGISCFVQENGRFLTTPRSLIRCDTILVMNAIRAGVEMRDQPAVPVLPWNFAFDVNGDGRDDVLVPHDKGTDLYLQQPAGQLAKPITLALFPLVYHFAPAGPKPDEFRQRAARAPWFRVAIVPVESRDVNGDGRMDLVSGADHLGRRYWFAHKVDGTFDPARASLPPDADEPGNSQTRRVDINGDKRLDTFIEDTDVTNVFRILTIVRVYLTDANGRPPDKPQLIRDQNVLIHTKLPLHDFDGDGALDFAMFKTDITPVDIGKWVRQCFGKIDGYLNLFLFDRKANAYPSSPVYRQWVTMRFKVDPTEALMGLVWERYLSTMMRFEGDFNGDGRLDLLLRDKTEQISIYFNSGDRRRLFSSDPDIVLPDLPDFAGIALSDLNGDGCTDLLLYGTVHAGGPDHVVAVYVSKRQ
ncbi:MAG TPA: VCBS repeat-containing protein [Planctomycetota bacterium]|nr:VCBS repeat-containing protein [Planctomycetota bacterium]